MKRYGQRRNICYCLTPFLAVAGLTSAFSTVALAEVTLDGTMGPAGALTGPDYHIPATAGQRVGSNLFHSFGRFTVDTQESATFSGPAAIERVIGRVTGGQSSWIDGSLRNEIPSADLYLLNPAGVMFGPNASLDVNGAFHVSTADFLRLGEDGRFDASQPESSLLTSAPPSAFGFMGENPAAISVQSGDSETAGSGLNVPEGQTLSLVGGELTVRNGVLTAPSGQLQVASVASAGEVIVTAVGLETGAVARHGDITISDASRLDVSGVGGGRIVIRGGRLVVNDRSGVRADTLGDRPGRGIDIEVDELTMRGSVLSNDTSGDGNAGNLRLAVGSLTVRDGAAISASTLGAGRGGDLQVVAESIFLSEDGNSKFTGITSQVAPGGSTGDAGDLTVEVGTLEIRDGAEISTSTFGAGKGGAVRVTADNIFLSDDGSPQFTGITSAATPESTGDAGNLTVKATTIEVRNGAEIRAATFATGDGGDLRVTADRILLSGDGSADFTGIGANAAHGGSTGDAGNLVVEARTLAVRNGAEISATTFGTGRGGNVRVVADNILLSGDGTFFFTGIAAASSGLEARAGDGGALTVEAGRLAVRDGATISVNSFGAGRGGDLRIVAEDILLSGDGSRLFTGIAANAVSASRTGAAGTLAIEAGSLAVREGAAISASSFGAGQGGDLQVAADNILLSGDGSAFFTGIAAASACETCGDAGRVTVQAGDLRLDHAFISTATVQAGGGSIEIQAQDLVTLIESAITTSVAGGDENAGNIGIASPVVLTLVEGSRIAANAFAGTGGNVRIVADALIQSPDSVIEASSQLGIDGVIKLNAPDTDITGGLLGLPATFLDATQILRRPCTERSAAEVIRFVVRKYEVLPDSPHALRVPLPAGRSAAKAKGPTSAAQDTDIKRWSLAPMSVCSGDA